MDCVPSLTGLFLIHPQCSPRPPPTTNAGAGISAGPVHCVENHDGAYRVWRDAGVTQRLLVHVDAHHDLYGRWIDRKNPKERARINIANFVYAALEEELVRELIWVVPAPVGAASPPRMPSIPSQRGRSSNKAILTSKSAKP